MRVTRLPLSTVTADQMDIFVSKIINRLKSGTIEQITKAVSVGYVLPHDDLKDVVMTRLNMMIKNGTVTHTGDTLAIVPKTLGRPRIHPKSEPKVAKAKRGRPMKAKRGKAPKTLIKRGRKRLFSGLPPVSSYEN